MKYSRPRGTQDILPPAVYAWRLVEGAFESTLRRFGYDEGRTPVFDEKTIPMERLLDV